MSNYFIDKHKYTYCTCLNTQLGSVQPCNSCGLWLIAWQFFVELINNSCITNFCWIKSVDTVLLKILLLLLLLSLLLLLLLLLFSLEAWRKALYLLVMVISFFSILFNLVCSHPSPSLPPALHTLSSPQLSSSCPVLGCWLPGCNDVLTMWVPMWVSPLISLVASFSQIPG